jgi:hypothetical protein
VQDRQRPLQGGGDRDLVREPGLADAGEQASACPAVGVQDAAGELGK